MTDMATVLPPTFYDFTRKQAREYLARFVDEMPASRNRMAGMLSDAGADPGLATEPSREHLGPVWDAAVAHWPMRWQDGFVPSDPTDPTPHRQPSLDVLGSLDDLPSWFAHERYRSLAFSPETLWTADVLARYLGDVVIAEHPHLTWTLGPTRPAANIDRNWPVVGTARGWIAPLYVTFVLLRGTITGDPRRIGPKTLGELYDRNIRHVAE